MNCFVNFTDDLGRTVGSYERFCLRSLKERYKNEPLLLKKIQSNFRLNIWIKTFYNSKLIILHLQSISYHGITLYLGLIINYLYNILDYHFIRYIAREILQGLHYLHTLPNPIIHRDIKPSNVLVLTDCECPNPLACVCRKQPKIVSNMWISIFIVMDVT